MERRRDHLTAPRATDEENAAAVARALQRGLAPEDVPDVAGLDIAACYRAGGIGDVGGDWYDVLCLREGGVGVVIGDVAGRGIAAATTMGQLRQATRAYLLEHRSPAAVLARLNRLMAWLLPGEIATAAIGLLAADLSTVTLASAGHPPVLRLTAAGPAYVEHGGGPALGVHEDGEYADERVALNPGEGLLLYTDGLVERRGETIDAGLARLADAVAARGPAAALDELLDSAPDDAGDDLAILRLIRVQQR